MELTMLETQKNTQPLFVGLEEEKTTPQRRRLDSLVQTYIPCQLEDLGGKALMDRTDTKFMLPMELGMQILAEMRPHYQLLEINGQRLQPYNTLYFDTPDFYFYREHLRNRETRFKLRIRSYLVNNLTFLEVKQRTNKGRTVKERIQIDSYMQMLFPEALSWAIKRLPNAAWPLEPVLNNQFYRILLINPEKAERITLDFELQFSNRIHTVNSGSLVVAEVKRKSCHDVSMFINWLHSVHQRQSSFSKYCLGLALLNPEISHNKLKPNLIKLQKMQEIRCA